MPTLPTGTVTFLFTDIEGSTHLLQVLGNSRYAEALADHNRLMRAAFDAGDGHIIETHGDGFFVAFQSARDAILTAVTAQRAISAHPWPDGVAPRVRMGLHTADTFSSGGAYVGLGIHRAARICSAAWGGQVLLSRTTSDVIENDLPEGAWLRYLGEHRLKDLQRPERIFQLLHPSLHADFPPLRTLDSLPNNLPRSLTSFIGREREIAEVKRLLAGTRLLTLTGSGGCGKTRLALQVAAEVLEEFKHGVWVVELGAIADQTLVHQTVASALGVREQPGHPLMETLGDFLRLRSLLLVLDNCEHVLPACAGLADTLLRACPGLRILATSREALGIAGETRWRVPSLSLPDVHRPLSLEQLKQYEAARLFIERATASLPTFTVTAQDVPAVAQVCHRLDGIPLALELAAARVRVLAVHQIATRLDDRFHFLTGGSRTAVPRHQTLLSTMEWSYDLLSETERMLFRTLSVFAGSFSLEAVEAVCSGEGIERNETLDLLAQLVDKSLVVAEEAGGEARYRLLETVRQFGQDRLKASGEAARVYGRHRDFFRALAERAEPELRGPDQALWLERLEVEHDNLRAAMGWSAEGAEAEPGLRLTGALWRFWYVRGYYEEGRGWLDKALNGRSDVSPALRAKALGGAGYLATNQGDFAAALRLLEESLAIQRQLGDKAGIAHSLNSLGALAFHQGDLERAQALYEEGLGLARTLGAEDIVGMLLNNLGALAGIREDFAAACWFLEESLAIRRQLRDKRGVAFAAGNLGLMAFRQGDYAKARLLAEESLAIAQELEDKRGRTSQLEALGLLAAVQGQAERAARILGAAEALREAIGTPMSPSERALFDYDSCVTRIRAMLGRTPFAAVWMEGRAMTMDEAIQYALGRDA